jgi:hypothetical protein
MLKRILVLSFFSILLPILPAFPQDKPDTSAQSKAAAAAPASADEAAKEAADLAKAAQNPVANMISVPIQNNTNFGIGAYSRDQDVLNLQPVVPLHISKNWNVITRTILPIIWQPNSSQPSQGWYGFGDLNPSLFLSPAHPGKLIWGVGPAIVIPTATADQLGQGKLSLGPGIVGLTMPGHWVIGVLANNVWSVAGSGGRPDVNQFLLQYFLNYNMKKGWYVTSSPVITSDWKASSGNSLTLPFGGGVGRIMKLGFQPVNIQAQFFGNAKYPSGASPWGMRLQLALLYPKFTKKQEMMMMEKKLKEMQEAPEPTKK